MSGTPIYLDYQASTPLDPRVRDDMEPYWMEKYGNPHSETHCFGWEANEAVEFARGQVADLIGSDDNEIVFVSGATESCNLALRGIASASKKRNHIVTLATEHPAVLETVQWLGIQGFDIDVVPVKRDGIVDLPMLGNYLSERTLVVSVMLANNEIGVIQPVSEISDLCHAVGALMHTDATQALGRMHVDVDKLGIDLLSLSGHKLYGPNGVGVLYIRSNIQMQIDPILTGGSQERGIRPGTIATPLIVGLGKACEIACDEWSQNAVSMGEQTNHIKRALLDSFPDLVLFGHEDIRIPGNLSLGVPGVLAERLVNTISNTVAISTGSACSTGSPKPSHVLIGLGYDYEIASTGLRISTGRFTTDDQVNTAIDVIRDAINRMMGRSI